MVDVVRAVPKDQVTDAWDLAIVECADVSAVMVDAFDAVSGFGAIESVGVGEQGESEVRVGKRDIARAVKTERLPTIAQDFLGGERLICEMDEALSQKSDAWLRSQLPEWKTCGGGPDASDRSGRSGRKGGNNTGNRQRKFGQSDLFWDGGGGGGWRGWWGMKEGLVCGGVAEEVVVVEGGFLGSASSEEKREEEESQGVMDSVVALDGVHGPPIFREVPSARMFGG